MNLNLDGKPRENRMLAVGLAVVAAGLLIFAAFSRNWVSRPGPDIGFGPMGCTNCAMFAGAEGGDMSNAEFISLIRELDPVAAKTASSAFSPMGWATFGLSLLGALGLLGAAFLGFTKSRKPLPIAPSTIALIGAMLSLITACVFVATKPGGPGFVGVSMGFWLYGIGAVMGIASAQMLAKLTRPEDPDLVAAMNGSY
ncbi:MAG: hypothetical protein H0T46_15325 [Deltaproteobacteria bacterium]|nr:hypothetical protein [Deltaproteobacteria bacterium]